jgi:hypothetical protein
MGFVSNADLRDTLRRVLAENRVLTAENRQCRKMAEQALSLAECCGAMSRLVDDLLELSVDGGVPSVAGRKLVRKERDRIMRVLAKAMGLNGAEMRKCLEGRG